MRKGNGAARKKRVAGLRIERIPLDALRPSPYNPRKMSPAELRKLEQSMDEFGLVEPVVWNRKTGNVVGGHQRLKVLRRNQIRETDVVVVNVSAEKEKALNIALNRITGSWDQGQLATLLDEMKGEPDILRLTGMDGKEVDRLLNDLGGDGAEGEDEYRFAEELLEAHNYVVLYFDNEMDWQAAKAIFDLGTTHALDSRKGYQRAGTGRVVKGGPVVRALQKSKGVKVTGTV
jgi:ParB-like chromosome segregation protein Spo0J